MCVKSESKTRTHRGVQECGSLRKKEHTRKKKKIEYTREYRVCTASSYKQARERERERERSESDRGEK